MTGRVFGPPTTYDRTTLTLGLVESWYAPLGDPALQPHLGVLSATEEACAAAFVQAQDRQWYRAAHAMLRLVLAGYTGQQPAALTFATVRKGKPVLANIPHLHFSFSRSGGIGLVAVAALPLGADVEPWREVPEAEAIARQYFARTEAEHLHSARNQQTTFLRLWVAKEAVAKALGEGLSDCLSNFLVFLNEPSGARVRAINPVLDVLTLRELDLPGAAAAVAVQGPVQEVRLRRFVPNA